MRKRQHLPGWMQLHTETQRLTFGVCGCSCVQLLLPLLLGVDGGVAWKVKGGMCAIIYN